MSMEIILSQEAQQTRVAIAGAPTVGQLCSLFQVLGIDSAAWTGERAVLDLGSVRTRFSDAERDRLQREAAHNLHGKRLTLLWREEP